MLLVTEELELRILHRLLTESGMQAEIDAQLAANNPCRHLGLEWFSTETNGDMTYASLLAFGGSDPTEYLEADYNYDISSGSSPTIPNDSVDSWTSTPVSPPALPDVIWRDGVSYDFMTHVLHEDNLPEELLLALTQKDLVYAWVEHDDQSDVVKSFWKYSATGQSDSTIVVWADHLGSSTFGDLNIVP